MGIFSLKSGPKSKKVKEEGCVVTLSLELPAEEVEQETQNALVRAQSRARIPGFRQGKAPLDVVKQHFSGHAREEALDALIRKHVPAAIEAEKLRVVETPTVSDVKWKPGEPLTLEVQVEVAPAPTAKDYLKIPVIRKSAAVGDDAVAKRLEELREAHARLEAAPEDAVGDKHFAVVDYSAARDGKPIPNAKGSGELVDMSAEQSVQGLVEGLTGMKRGETKTIRCKVGGQDADFTVTLKEIKVKVLPAVDAEFAKDVGFETVDELKAKLKEVLEREAKQESEHDSIRQIEEALVKNNKFPLPPSMVERQLEGMLQRLTRQFAGQKLPEKTLADLKEKMQPRAEDEVRLAFVLDAIAQKEKVEVADAELQAELDASLKDAESEERKAEMRETFERRKDQVRHMLRERKTMALLREKAVYKDA